MKKTNFKCYIKNVAFSINNVYNLIGNLDGTTKHISYKEDDIDVDISYKDELHIIRETNEYLIDMKFILNEKQDGIYLLKATNTYLELKVYASKIEIKNKSILINYNLEIANETLDNFEYYLEWSDVNEKN